MHVKHRLVREGALESREYQKNILARATKENLLCVLPTGLGKTPIAIMLAARRLEKYPDSKILVLAPTKPLVSQHHKSFLKTLKIEKSDAGVVTGATKPAEREKFYREKRLIFATPQTIQNDLKNRRLSLRDFSLLVVDEVHHSIGRYAYPYVAREYQEQARNPRILGLTASPGASPEKIREICDNTGIQAVEIRSETDSDVAPYVQKKLIEWLEVELPESFQKIRGNLKTVYDKKIETLKKLGFLRTKRVTKKGLLDLQKGLIAGIKEGYKKAYLGVSLVVQAIKLEHAIGLLETQGIGNLEKYWKKIRAEKSGASKALVKDKNVSAAMWLTGDLLSRDSRHPKMGKLCSIVHQQLNLDPDSKIIVFANFRETVREIVSVLEKISGAKPVAFVGQKLGMTQKEQVKILNDFRKGKYNILVGTSISEEGLHVENADIAIFYEPVPSPLRSIQRRGRVGRTRIGKVIVLITKRTRDEAYYWSAKHKEKDMKRILYDMRSSLDKFGKK